MSMSTPIRKRVPWIAALLAASLLAAFAFTSGAGAQSNLVEVWDQEGSISYGDGVNDSYGQSVGGVVRPNLGDLWTFRGTRGDVITISMSSSVIDPRLALYDRTARRWLTSDTDGGVGNGADLSVRAAEQWRLLDQRPRPEPRTHGCVFAPARPPHWWRGPVRR